MRVLALITFGFLAVNAIQHQYQNTIQNGVAQESSNEQAQAGVTREKRERPTKKEMEARKEKMAAKYATMSSEEQAEADAKKAAREAKRAEAVQRKGKDVSEEDKAAHEAMSPEERQAAVAARRAA